MRHSSYDRMDMTSSSPHIYGYPRISPSQYTMMIHHPSSSSSSSYLPPPSPSPSLHGRSIRIPMKKQHVYDNVSYSKGTPPPLLAYSNDGYHPQGYIHNDSSHYHDMNHMYGRPRIHYHIPQPRYRTSLLFDPHFTPYFYERTDDSSSPSIESIESSQSTHDCPPPPDYSPPIENKCHKNIPHKRISYGQIVQLSVPSSSIQSTRDTNDEVYHSSSISSPSIPSPRYAPLRPLQDNKIIECNEDENVLVSSLKSLPPPLPPRPPSKHRIHRLSISKDDQRKVNEGYSSTISEKQSIAPPPRPQPPPSSISSTPTLPRAVPGQSPFNASGVTVAYPSMNRNDNTIKSSTNIFGMKKNNKDTKKKRIRKEDISNPTNFQHKAHVGWDQDTGFSNNADPNPLDDTIRTILKAAGEDPSQMSKKTIKFVYDFIEKYQEDGQPINNGSSFPQSQRDWPIPRSAQSSSPSIPLPPSRGSSSSSTILPPPSRPPPPPPSSINRIRPLPILPNGRPIDGPPLPPSSIHSSSVPPPPPPPPPSLPPISSGPPPPPPPPPLGGAPPPPPSIPSSSSTTTSSSNPSSGNLLAEIQAGKQLKSVGDQMEKKSLGTPDSRDDVMAQIRLGTTLRHIDVVEKEKRKSSGVDNVGGIAGALARALEERRQNMGMDDNDSDDDNNDSENDWSD